MTQCSASVFNFIKTGFFSYVVFFVDLVKHEFLLIKCMLELKSQFCEIIKIVAESELLYNMGSIVMNVV